MDPLRMNMESNLGSRQVFVDYDCHSSGTSYKGEQIKDKNIVKDEWMDEKAQEGSMQTPGIHSAILITSHYDQN